MQVQHEAEECLRSSVGLAEEIIPQITVLRISSVRVQLVVHACRLCSALGIVGIVPFGAIYVLAAKFCLLQLGRC